MDLAAAVSLGIAIVGVAVAVTPRMRNLWTAFAFWGTAALYGLWLVSSYRPSLEAAAQRNPALAVAGAILFVIVCGGSFVSFFRRHRDISIDGVNGYLSRHVAGDRYFVIAPDVTITNHRKDQPASIGAEFVVIEDVEMAATNTPYGPTEICHVPLSCRAEVDPVPMWEGRRNRQLEFPLHLEPGHTKRGHVAFEVWHKRHPTWALPENRRRGTLVFIDYGTGKPIKKLPKEDRLFIGSF